MPTPHFYKKQGQKSGSKVVPTKNIDNHIQSAKWLVIVESPSKCAKIEEYLSSLEDDPVFGGKYACIASKGHIRSIDGLKSINTKTDFAPNFSVIEGKEKHVRDMQRYVAMFPRENILIATDDDREGEAIGWHICEVCALPIQSTKRILFHEITKTAICDAIKNPTTLNMSLVFAQHARQVLDIIVGFTISPLLWKHIYNDKLNGLSAGRCQTPALRIIYDHSKEYQTHSVSKKYLTTGTFFDRNIRFELSQPHTTEEELAVFLVQSRTHPYTLEMMATKETYKSPPKPFTTSRLLQSASSILRMSPKKTMELCQQLYQSGLITYMRTDSSKYSPVFLRQAESYIENEWGSTRYIGDMNLLENRDASNPHEAIRVTNIRMRNITADDRSLVSMYRFIWKNTIESCMAIAKYNSRLVKISSPDPTRHYGYTLEIPIFLGWKQVSSNKDASDEVGDNGVDQTMLQTGLQFYFESFLANSTAKAIPYNGKPSPEYSTVRVNYIESRVVAEHRSPHYTEASLIQHLEELGIGRPSTYATIVETIQERGYVKKTDVKGTTVTCSEYKLRFDTTPNSEYVSTLEKNEIEKVFGSEKGKLVITPTGIIVLEFLVQYFEGLFSYDYTKTMECALDTISESPVDTAFITWNAVCKECYSLIKKSQKPLNIRKKETYAIDKNVELVFHSTGASLKYTLEDGQIQYRTVNKNVEIDLGKLKNGEYSVLELLEIPNEHLGTFGGHDVLLKSGRYGLYAECGEIKTTLAKLDKPANEITLMDVIPILIEKNRKESAKLDENRNAEDDDQISNEFMVDLSTLSDTYRGISTPVTSNVTSTSPPSLRVLSPDMSVRLGKYGAYIYYKNSKMRTPSFLNIKKYKENCWECDPDKLIEWVKTTYRLS